MEAPALLRLPPELRNQIFEHVLCHNKIHVGMRPTQAEESGGFPHGSEPIWFTERYKPMYCVCLNGDEWNDAYELSKFDDTGENVANLRAKTHDHKACERVLNDLRWQDFMRMPTPRPCECVTRPCPHFFEHRRNMIAKYGAPPEGLKVAHANTKLDLSLLSTCKTIYNETSLLPYSGNTFCFHVPVDLNAFLDQVLTQAQRDAIQTLQVYMGALSRPTLPDNIPRDLKMLQCHVASLTLAVITEDMHETLGPWSRKFEEVQLPIAKPT
ncbi:hypothetical protein CERZMDRAFT_98915 [Cercospora zeae-maydis SCOH1-5]|uniref:Uncharacterized protein n=1 Tax=Cercospora zeae-maydis SCOH1-5 TaxID=717836 RepID=A0A6A6FCR1_9PEZI|nr:hypothetical protein CERZMDRAFT_98915 [Cercospora zeae-maydis SCOH1-5]